MKFILQCLLFWPLKTIERRAKDQTRTTFPWIKEWANYHTHRIALLTWHFYQVTYFIIFREIPVEKGFLDLTTQEDRCVIHFFHEDFRRCAIIDTHLEVCRVWDVSVALITKLAFSELLWTTCMCMYIGFDSSVVKASDKYW
mgnify:CR=1 FL=1